MIEVLEPFEVAHSHTAGVAENVGEELDAFVKQNFLSLHSGRPVGCLHNQFGLELVRVVDVDSLLQGSRNKEITFIVDSRLVIERFSTGVALDTFGLGPHFVLL